ncbi:MAG TPA: fibronectin type III domain-containing protein, partial [Fibrella sp.]
DNDGGMANATDDKVTVYVSTGCGTPWTPIYVFNASNPALPTNVLTDYLLDLSAYTGQTVQIGFQGTDGPTDNTPDYDFHITAVKIDLTPSCESPSSISASAITPTSATISWPAASPVPTGGYFYEVRSSGAPDSGASGLAASGSTATLTANITGLTPGTLYTIYVRSSCDTAFGPWTSATFTTKAVVPVPWAEGFATTTLPTGWTSGFTVGNATGLPGNPGNTLYKNLYGSVPTSNFTTPNLGPIIAGQAFMFDYNLANFSDPYGPVASGSGNFIVAVSIDYGITFTNLETITNDGVAGWRTKIYPLGAYVGNDVTFRITANRTAGDYNLAFDNFAVTLPPSCFRPESVTVSNFTATTANLSWPAASPVPGVGYEYAVTTSATPPASGTPVTGTTATATGLTTGVTYYAHVRSECTAGTDYSNWRTSASFIIISGETCQLATNLALQTSPLTSTTAGLADNFDPTCNSGTTIGPDRFFTINVPAGWILNIGQTANDYDSVHAMFYGSCAAQTQIMCLDGIGNAEFAAVTWQNTTGAAQNVFWVQDAWNTGSGAFTLAWTLAPPPIVISGFTPTTVCSVDAPTTVVTLTGSNFTGATSVTLGGAETTFTVVNDTTINVNLTASSIGGTFTVTNAVTSGTSAGSLAINQTPTVAPITGPTFVCLPNT